MKSFKQYISEDIEIVNDIVRPKEYDWNHVPSPKKSKTFENLGKIHKDYSIYSDSLRNSFVITHDDSKKVVGEIQNEMTMPKELSVGMLAIHKDHTKKKIGHSLAVAAYKHLNIKHGYMIYSGDQQSRGAAGVWQELLKDPKTRTRVRVMGSRGEDLGQASKKHTGDIWTSGSKEVRRAAGRMGIKMHKYGTPEASSAEENILVLNPNNKGKKK